MIIALVSLHCPNKRPQIGWLKSEKFVFSQFWRPGGLRSRCWPIWFLLRSLLLAFCRSPSPRVLTWQRKRALASLLFYKNTNPRRLRSYPMSSLNVYYLHRRPISKYSHIARGGGVVRATGEEFERGTFQSIAITERYNHLGRLVNSIYI